MTNPEAISGHSMTPEEALRLWDEASNAQWPRGTDPSTEIDGLALADIDMEAHGALDGVWGRTPMRRASPRLYLDVRPRLEAIIPDLDAAVEITQGEGRAHFLRLRDLVGWVIERPREA